MTRRRNPLVLILVLAAVFIGRAVIQKEAPGAADLQRAFAEAQSDVMMTVEGEVERILEDDLEGRRHQRFIVRVGDLTVLVAHNIDLARRVPLSRGDDVVVRGEYEWNEKGGVLHWTHHDPDGRHDPGWIEHEGERYQ